MNRPRSTPSRVLFLCTGNYYRSRYAEILFNDHAERLGLPWRADSRGFALNENNPGPISAHVVDRLKAGETLRIGPHRNPLPVTEEDLRKAERIIALDETEHRPLMTASYPRWEGEIEYWDVPDLPHRSVKEALDAVERKVLRLVQSLAQPRWEEGGSGL